jgi:poly(ADP-ribose) glycohydrolase ARH3
MSSLLDRFLGCLLGHAVGDAVAAPYEGLDAQTIYYNFGSTRALVDEPLQAELCYTDDTQLSIAVAEALLECGAIKDESLSRAFVANYDPARGYGQGTRRIIETMGTGGDWRALTKSIFPGGSLGNGAAMRAAPVGLLFHDDLDRVAEEARRSALPTHVHPIGIEGAQLISLAVAIALRGGPFDRKDFFAELFGFARTETFQRQLARAAEMSPDDPVDVFGNSLPADESVVTALACFAGDPESYPAVIARAIRIGNDTDTIAAMAGAISGARLAIAAVPARLLEKLENGHKGRDHIRSLAERLYEAFARRSAHQSAS